MSKYADLKGRYPEDLTLNEMRTILHISKRKASYMLKNGYMPCEDSGKKPPNFRVKLKDVISYLKRDRKASGNVYASQWSLEKTAGVCRSAARKLGHTESCHPQTGKFKSLQSKKGTEME